MVVDPVGRRPDAQAQDRQTRALLLAEQQVEDLALLGGAEAAGAVQQVGALEGHGEAESVDGLECCPEVDGGSGLLGLGGLGPGGRRRYGFDGGHL
ncbi:hypothetical protein [Streptomyces narbonensis]|uniref:hypothetical protein n=1 Tax=Streptomyces narbonensis TaxID=67333 RepID=UPI00362E532B